MIHAVAVVSHDDLAWLHFDSYGGGIRIVAIGDQLDDAGTCFRVQTGTDGLEQPCIGLQGGMQMRFWR